MDQQMPDELPFSPIDLIELRAQFESFRSCLKENIKAIMANHKSTDKSIDKNIFDYPVHVLSLAEMEILVEQLWYINQSIGKLDSVIQVKHKKEPAI